MLPVIVCIMLGFVLLGSLIGIVAGAYHDAKEGNPVTDTIGGGAVLLLLAITQVLAILVISGVLS